jgi:hypothetical protein
MMNFARRARALRCAAIVAATLAAGCAHQTPPNTALNTIGDQLQARTERPAQPPVPAAVREAVLPTAPIETPRTWLPEPRFDLAVSNAPAAQVFMAIVTDTRYSMLLPPDLPGKVTINLKDVTVREAHGVAARAVRLRIPDRGQARLRAVASPADPPVPGELPDDQASGSIGRPRELRLAGFLVSAGRCRGALPGALPAPGARCPGCGLAQRRGEPPGHHHRIGLLGDDLDLAVGDRRHRRRARRRRQSDGRCDRRARTGGEQRQVEAFLRAMQMSSSAR